MAEEQPLRRFFQELVVNTYSRKAGITDEEIAAYVAQLLAEFTWTDRLYPMRTSSGRFVEELNRMLEASDPVFGTANSFGQERAMRKHIGDYALFLSGMFPESLAHWKAQQTDFCTDLVATGRESYYIVSQFNLFEYEREASLFGRLADNFESCVDGLKLVRQELQRTGARTLPPPAM